MKIDLVAINSRYTHTNLALLYLKEAIHELGHEVVISEFSINQNILEILKQLYLTKADLIAISVYIWNTELIKKLLPEIKKLLPETKILLGGPEVSYNTEVWLAKFNDIDYIIKGQGEAALHKLLENDLEYSSQIISEKNFHFSEIKFPYQNCEFNSFKNRYIYYESSRGCPFKCSYCLSSRSDQKLEFRNISQVKEELAHLIRLEPTIVKFIDRTFNAQKSHSREIWKFLLNVKTSTIFHFEIHPALLENEDFEILKNCPEKRFQFEIGVQSTNQKTLESIERNYNWDKIEENIKRLIHLKNIRIHLDLIAGLPYEGLKELEISFNHIYKLKANHFQLGFLKILPGTKIADQKSEFKISHLESAPYQVLSTRWISAEELNLVSDTEHLIDNIYNQHHFDMTLNSFTKQYCSAFQFFVELAKFYQQNSFDLSIKSPQKLTKNLFSFAAKFKDSVREYIHDALRWDWCRTNHNHFYPNYLTTEKIANMSKKSALTIKTITQDPENNIKLKYKNLIKLAFFTPQSEEFKNEFILNYSFVMFGSPDNLEHFKKFSKMHVFKIVKFKII
jgi:radical SAM superfamily enzyme YgiQ (UPF0313 family)